MVIETERRLRYPKRPQFFANKFCRLMMKVCLANQIGPESCYLLATVAMTEDAKGYRSAVTFFNEQLMAFVGTSDPKALRRLRDKAIEAGWLHYEAGGKGIAGRYWVTVPEEYISVDDFPADENPAEYRSHTRAKSPQKVPQQCPDIVPESAPTLPQKVPSIPPTPLPVPEPRENTAVAVLKSDDAKPVAKEAPKPPRTPQPIDPYFEEICSLIGDAHRVPSGSRIAKVARAMLKTELKPEQIRGLPDVVKKYQHWRTTIDIAAVEATWPWILTPPTTTSTPGQSRYRSHDQQLFDELNSLEGVS